MNNALRSLQHVRNARFKLGKDYLCMATQQSKRLLEDRPSIGLPIRAESLKKMLWLPISPES